MQKVVFSIKNNFNFIMNKYSKLLSTTIIFASLLIYTQPANAYFRLEIPKQLTELWQKVQAQEASKMEPTPTFMPPPTQTPPPMPQPTNFQQPPVNQQPNFQPPTNQQPNFQNPPPPMNGQNFQPGQQPMPFQPQPNDSTFKPGNFPPNQFNEKEPQTQPNNFPNKPPMMERAENNNQDSNQGGKNQNSGDQGRMIKDIQRGAKQMEGAIGRFDKQLLQAEKSGGVVSPEMKEKITQAKELITKIKSSTTAEEVGDDAMDQLQEIVSDLDQNGREVFEKIQRLNNVKRDIKNLRRNVANFDKQVTKLTRQNIVVPQDTTDNIAKLKTIVSAVETAKTWDEVEAAGLEDMGDLMQNLGESQQSLEMLARWPQTLKQMDKELKKLNNQVRKSKSTVDRLTKKGIDLTENLANFSTEVDKLKSVRDEANSKVQSGDSQGAFDLVENDFFNKMDDVYENQRIIDTMSNLRRFNSDFKNGLNSLKREITNLKRKGEDTSELQSIYDEVKQKGDEVTTLMKTKPIDTDAIVSALEDLGNLRQQGMDKSQEMGGGEPMPWEQGQPQIQQLSMPSTMKQYITPKAIIDPLFKPTGEQKQIVDPSFSPVKIIDPLFKPSADKSNPSPAP